MNCEEAAVLTLRKHKIYKRRMFESYLDGKLLKNANRFYKSEEFNETLSLIWKFNKGHDFLDIGAGPGFSSVAFSRAHYNVTAIEPNPSYIIGSGAIIETSRFSKIQVRVIRSISDQLPFKDNSFDIIYFRQSLHHMPDILTCLAEAYRVLRPRGLLVAIREHVVSNKRQLKIFLNKHPLHQLCGGENAYTLKAYKAFFEKANLKLLKVIGPFASEINYYPFQPTDLAEIGLRRIGLSKFKLFFILIVKFHVTKKAMMILLNSFVKLPGRNYSFFVMKA